MREKKISDGAAVAVAMIGITPTVIQLDDWSSCKNGFGLILFQFDRT